MLKWRSLRNPTRFAAAIPICGGGDPTKADLIKDLPLWTAHGDDDQTVPPKSTLDMVTALKELGSTIHYDPLPGVAHDAWSPTYAKQELIDWLFTFERGGSSGGSGGGGMAGAAGAGAGGSEMGGAAGGSGGAGGAGLGGATGSDSSSAGSTGGGSPAVAGASALAGAANMPIGSAGTNPTFVAESTDEDGGCSFGPAAPSSSAALYLASGFLALLISRRRTGRMTTR